MPEITIRHDERELVVGLGADAEEAARQAAIATAEAAAIAASAAQIESNKQASSVFVAGPAAIDTQVGFYIGRATGNIVANANYTARKYTAAAGEVWRVSSTIGSDIFAGAVVVYFDAGDALLGFDTAAPGSGYTYLKQHEFTPPANTAYFWITCSNTNGLAPTVEKLALKADSAKEAERAAEAADDLAHYAEQDLSALWQDGFYTHGNTGVVTASASFTTARLPIEGGDLMRFSGTIRGGTSVAALVFFTPRGTYLSKLYTATSSTVDDVYVDQTFTAPADARAVALTVLLANKDTARLEVLGTADGDGIALFDDVRDLKATVYPISGQLVGQTALITGTSIPWGDGGGANSYPFKIAALTGMAITNKAIASSCARIGVKANITGGDPFGEFGMAWNNWHKCLMRTTAEIQSRIDNYATYQPNIPGSPATLTAQTQAEMLSYGYENRIVPSLGKDIYLIEHAHNDAFVGVGGYEGTDLVDEFNADPDSRDRTTWHGAINTLIDIIRAAEPKARIVFVGHYEDARKAQVSQAQALLADYHSLPLVELWRYTGWTQEVITGAGPNAGDTITELWMPDDLHPHSDTTGEANDFLASLIARELARMA
ncbi:SGNH/GDSL hydrolase family protein [Qipengyuania sp. 6B39]|uniref:SGNH/GDSL hydrolase family protein n=1 Tax=Qipengyuania proteolytica TaxID=2867239 RepID=UPI001C897E89|nr:SGNH/GDSL hydrolase family protein [Qipengyuania proteolytica]MBX7496753.1 SGNH/GDSL hydrolase family protein [Qipengyuania proteolytica]